MSEEPIIDPEAIENLRALDDEGGGDTFLREVIEIFKEDTPLRIQEMRDSLRTGDQVCFTRAAHSIKGSSSNVGANRLRSLAQDLEARSRESLEGLASDVEEMDRVFREACDALGRL